MAPFIHAARRALLVPKPVEAPAPPAPTEYTVNMFIGPVPPGGNMFIGPVPIYADQS